MSTINRIEFDKVKKSFSLKHCKNRSTLEVFSNFFKNKTAKNHTVLEDISFSAKPGEVIGIIGKNGSGKSTLLRLVAGIYLPDSGKIKTHGNIVYLSGFGFGLIDKLTMRENIFLLGSIMGLSQIDIGKKFDEIVDFSGLREYLDFKIRAFSTGMIVRLVSSIGIHCISHKKPDILLVDEVLGGGADSEFQKKTIKKMEELIKSGSTVLLVSHNLGAIKKYCDRALLLEDGKIVREGDPNSLVDNYSV